MHSFPYPRFSRVQPLKVPYVANFRFSGAQPWEFGDFNKPFLLLIAELCIAVNDPFRVDEYEASLLQSWLFFGLASKALGRGVAHQEFIEQPDDGGHADDNTQGRFIDPRIPQWFAREFYKRWDRLHCEMSAEDFEKAKQDLKECCESVIKVVARFDKFDEYEETMQNEHTQLVCMSIFMLEYIIAYHLGFAFTIATSGSKSTELLLRRMVHNGWCRKRLNFIATIEVDYPCLYFLSSFVCPQSRHVDHRLCTSTRCYHSTDLLPPLHRSVGCQCHEIRSPLHKVLRILAADEIPLVRLKYPNPQDTELEVIPYTKDIHFVAISHVWADRQLGSKENALPKCQIEHLGLILKKLPLLGEHASLWDVLPSRSPPVSPIEPPSNTYQFFWLDTFCIPQDPAHTHLRVKALESMNLVYAAASQTLVFDAGLQDFDVGQRPSSMFSRGRPTFFAPTDERLLDTLALICSSNWMGRAWTLQEGLLSSNCIFPFQKSLAYLNLLRVRMDHDDLQYGLKDYFVLGKRLLLGRSSHVWRDSTSDICKSFGEVPMYETLTRCMSAVVERLLDRNSRREYARDQSAQVSRFIKAHALLQSRSTTQPDDLPLILVNLSGLNGNRASQIRGTDDRMRSLIYGLGIVPTELLFSDCKRIRCGSNMADRWIPREVVPQALSGRWLIKLGPEGFAFQQDKDGLPMKFLIFDASCARKNQFRFRWPDEDGTAGTEHLAKVISVKKDQEITEFAGRWCILINHRLVSQAARFCISRNIDNKVFLHYDCPIRLFRRDDAEQLESDRLSLGDPYIPQLSTIRDDFIIERSSTSQMLSIPRPQNPHQYSDRLMFISEAVNQSIIHYQYLLASRLIEDRLLNRWFLIPLYAFIIRYQTKWIERSIYNFVHHAWTTTYIQNWNSDGQWRWFWKLMNFCPPVPFETIAMYYGSFLFYLCFYLRYWPGVLLYTIYWRLMYDIKKLRNMYIIAILSTGIIRLFGSK